MDNEEHWVDRFRSISRDRRLLMCEALAWKLKAQGEEWKRKLSQLCHAPDGPAHRLSCTTYYITKRSIATYARVHEGATTGLGV
jgi:hypothetical protein